MNISTFMDSSFQSPFSSASRLAHQDSAHQDSGRTDSTAFFSDQEGYKVTPKPIFTPEDPSVVQSDITDAYMLKNFDPAEASGDAQTAPGQNADSEMSDQPRDSRPTLAKTNSHHVFHALLDRIASSQGKDPAEFYAKMQERLGLFDI
ncbi:hypothetical protein [Celeribacter sp.]|uniref:hypothetical protein n=1 Tax=Celeribacter sp. TaxID=1890673 RepID=UPI003A931A1C